MRRSPDLARAAAVFLLVFSLYFVTYSRFLPATADEMLYFSLTQSLAKAHVVTIDQASTVGPAPEEIGVGGHRFSKKGPLMSLLAVPLFWAAQHLPVGIVDTVLLLNSILTASIVALLFVLARRLGYSGAIALALAGVAALSTPLWVYAKSFFAETTITLCVLGTIYAAHRSTTSRARRWLILTGLIFGAAVAAKNVNVVLLLPVPLYLGLVRARRIQGPPACEAAGRVPNSNPGRASPAGFAPARSPASGRPPGAASIDDSHRLNAVRAALAPDRGGLRQCLTAFFWFAVGVAPVALLLLLYSYVRYGTPFSSGYGEWETFSTPVWEGVFGILFSPGKSILVYTPLLILLPFWAPAFLRRHGRFGALLVSIVVLHVLLYGSWYVWWGAWGWASRFTVPILPLLVLLLAEGLSTVRRPAMKGLVVAMGVLGAAIQILGLSVHYSVYLGELMSINLRPDTLTLYDLARSPILQQLRFMSRTWLDFAWILPTGPDAVNVVALASAVTGVMVALVGFAVVWRSTRRVWWLATIGFSALAVLGVVFQDLHGYYSQGSAATMALGRAFERAPSDAAVLHMIPKSVVPYANWQKKSLPELGWSESPDVSPVILARLDDVIAHASELWVVTDTPARARSNGVETALTRRLAQLEQQQIGSYRLLRYSTHPESLPFVPTTYRFSNGITLTGFLVQDVPGESVRTLHLTLRWQADQMPAPRPDYTVFVHLVSPEGALVAQDDSPPADNLVPTGGWVSGQVVYDHHALAIPPSAGAGLHQARIGLYTRSDGKRASVLDSDGNAMSDFVTLELN